ncbi:MAG: hypothetical protein UY28_C0032G0011 [Candidatus Amesbacteria bacterium GW2011_GWB1_48_13]|uniref:Uncharacterized protein n=1 Tax=Candidatus Amesbacteria bacterium GW2011_GWB1_48_13 TaxID=1618362 RepID=A0A0G1UQW3_9BACT|nr:MAG: hypothetical protein UY28_C0032G0011 [Candidatus Amesbacteria bacterium GW2011_GWB1_48_13]
MRAFKKGFTLIELLVVIGVLAVIAAGVVALINPQDKIAQTLANTQQRCNLTLPKTTDFTRIRIMWV